MYGRVVVLFTLLVLPAQARAQDEPFWHRHTPRPTSAVDFTSGTGTGTTQAEARRSAYLNALSREVMKDSVRVRSQMAERIREVMRQRGSDVDGQLVSRVIADIEAHHGRSTLVPGLREVASHYQRNHAGTHRAWVLFAGPRPGTSKNELTQELDRLRAQRRRAIRWRSLVPGWAQFHKGQTTKGLFFLAGEAALAGVVLAGLHGQMRLQEKIDGASSGPRRRSYETPKTRLEALTLTGAVLAGALYAWNVADGWTGDSERFPLLSAEVGRARIERVTLQPVVTPRSAGARLTIALR